MLSLLFAAALLSSQPTAPAPETERELVVLVLIDALRADHVGAYGYERPTTPVLDRMAAKGTRYTRVYANAPWTRPSTASFFTGMNASRHRTETGKTKLPPEIRTVARRLRDVGWQTTGFSANGNGGSLAHLHRGWNLYEDPTNTYKRKETKQRCRKKYGADIAAADLKQAILEDCKRYNGLPTGEFIVKRALDHLRTSKAEKELLFLFLVDPHDPYYAPPEYERMFLNGFKGKIRRRALWERNNDYPEDERFSLLALYDAGIRYSDVAMGQLLDGLEKLGRKDDTTILVSADHGEGFGEHDFYLHAHHFWEEVIRVPLIATGKRFGPGVSNRLTQSIDVAATILDMAGADTSGIQGRSLLRPEPAAPYVISEYNEFGIHRQAIVGERYKVIWQRPADEAWYLRAAKKKEFFPSVVFDRERVRVFDLQKDPLEKNDLAPTMPAEAAKLLETLRAFVAESDAMAAKKS